MLKAAAITNSLLHMLFIGDIKFAFNSHNIVVPTRVPVKNQFVPQIGTNLQRSIFQALPCVEMQDVSVSFKA
jgi:hypothetical protein